MKPNQSVHSAQIGIKPQKKISLGGPLITKYGIICDTTKKEIDHCFSFVRDAFFTALECRI